MGETQQHFSCTQLPLCGFGKLTRAGKDQLLQPKWGTGAYRADARAEPGAIFLRTSLILSQPLSSKHLGNNAADCPPPLPSPCPVNLWSPVRELGTCTGHCHGEHSPIIHLILPRDLRKPSRLWKRVYSGSHEGSREAAPRGTQSRGAGPVSLPTTQRGREALGVVTSSFCSSSVVAVFLKHGSSPDPPKSFEVRQLDVCEPGRCFSSARKLSR